MFIDEKSWNELMTMPVRKHRNFLIRAKLTVQMNKENVSLQVLQQAKLPKNKHFLLELKTNHELCAISKHSDKHELS